MKQWMTNSKAGLRIAITGPESTGKTSLCRYLAEEYKTIFIPEYARSYLEKHGVSYDAADIPRFYKNQLERELKYASETNKPLFIDTEFSNASIWYHSKTGERHEWIQMMLNEHRYDLYLLLKPDIEWQHDPLRENPGRSEFFFNEFLDMMKKMDFNFRIISGSGKERFLMARKAVDELIKENLPDSK